ncbi:unnamed protein product [Linum tenue]|uniref:Uncharacterized protein n=1 Tax=Linum tenue TaxID=586396 RepID=A0AAV0PRF0_9ROSI|nr:unnamed protein product [Linum tenue]
MCSYWLSPSPAELATRTFTRSGFPN